MGAGAVSYRHAGGAVVRATVQAGLSLPPWPDVTGTTADHVRSWQQWLKAVWSVEGVAESITHASPALAMRVETLSSKARPDERRTQRAVFSVMRYLLRMQHRATPFGLFAGITPAAFGACPHVRWGWQHQRVDAADARWLAELVARLESLPNLLARLPVIANNACIVRGDRLIIPAPNEPGTGLRAEVSLRHTGPVRIALEAARTPQTGAAVTAAVQERWPNAPAHAAGNLVAELVRQGVLVTALRAPSTATDVVAYLEEQLAAVGAGDLGEATADLREIRVARAGRDRRVCWDGDDWPWQTKSARSTSVDVRLDGEIVLPQAIAWEAEQAASLLVRLSPHPHGDPAWQNYLNRFFATYGVGTLVPVKELVSDAGLGYPAGYPSPLDTPQSHAFSERDRNLARLAQAAALDGLREVDLHGPLGRDVTLADEQAHAPPHTELTVRIESDSLPAMGNGDFRLVLLGASRSVGTMSGRFAHLFTDEECSAYAQMLRELPACDRQTVPVQLSFPPVDPASASVARSPRVLDTVVAIGEHHAPSHGVIGVEDLAVGCDGERLYLVAMSLGQRVEPVVPHALNLRHTWPLVRFVAEVARSRCAVVRGFDWGTAASLPFLPRLRAGRTVVEPAQWRLDSAELTDHTAEWAQWERTFRTWCERRHLPETVELGRGDRRLHLDLAQSAHRALLREHIDTTGRAVLTEAPPPGAYGWCGDRPVEAVIPLAATGAHRRPPPAPPRETVKLHNHHSHLPGLSRRVQVRLHANPQRREEILTRLPELWARWERTPQWWFTIGPGQKVNLIVALQEHAEFGHAAACLSGWGEELRRVGLASGVDFTAYTPETGRWGTGAAMEAAEHMFVADAAAVAAQFSHRPQANGRVLAAAHFTAITCAFTGSTSAGLRWLIDHADVGPAAGREQREIRRQAVRLINPDQDWAALRATPGGTALVEAWAARDEAVDAYRAVLDREHDPDAERVLPGLLHAHYLRSRGPDVADEQVCHRLARAAALAGTSRERRGGVA
jgi:lantibiotic biosynthesis protein